MQTAKPRDWDSGGGGWYPGICTWMVPWLIQGVTLWVPRFGVIIAEVLEQDTT